MKKILGIILALGLILRLLFLGKRQLWTDELIQALAVQAQSAEEMFRLLDAGITFPSPLDSLVQRTVVGILGVSEWSLRFHAAIFGAAAVFFFYRLSQHLFGERVALYCSALFAIYPLNLHYSQEAGPWSLLLMLTLASYDLLFRQVSERSVPGGWLLLAVVLILLPYAGFPGAAVFVSQALGLLLTARAGRKAPSHAPEKPRDLPRAKRSRILVYFGLAGIAVVAFLPWVLYSSKLSVPGTFIQLRDPKLALTILKEIGDSSYAVTAMLVAGAAAGIRALRLHGRTRVLSWMLIWFFATLAAVLVIEAASGRPYAVSHLVHVVPPLVLLAGYGLSHVGERLRVLDRFPYALSTPAQLYCAAMLLASAWITFTHWNKEPVDWAGTARFLAETAQPGDALTMPRVNLLIEYHSPNLARYRADDLDPGPGTLSSNGVKRRRVVCFNGMQPDPCSSFRPKALKDKAWMGREFAGLTLFQREKQDTESR
jgi:uncharacterized membrane protein